MAVTRAILAIVLLVGCGTTQSDPPAATATASPTEEPPAPVASPEAEGTTIDGMWMPPGWSGAPAACTADADCMADTVPSPSSPCCNDPTTLRPYARAYRAAVQAWRAAECSAATCPPPPPPARPEPCAITARCVEGACRNSCGP